MEKLVYGDGAGDTFKSVTQTELGRLGQLNCWENMNPFLKSLNVSEGEQIHIAAWPVYPGKETLRYPDPATNVAEPASDLVTPAYAIETGTWTLAPFQRLSKEGLAMTTPEGVEPETDPSTYNGHARIYKPDGTLVVKPDKDFDGLLFVDVSLFAHTHEHCTDLSCRLISTSATSPRLWPTSRATTCAASVWD